MQTIRPHSERSGVAGLKVYVTEAQDPQHGNSFLVKNSEL